MERRKNILCEHCRRLVPYEIRVRKEKAAIKDTEFEFGEKYGVCLLCGNELTIPGLDDENEEKIEEIYRRKNGYITMKQIYQILAKYRVEKRPLSNLLGWGELTITRYLDGQLPGKKYSDILITLLNSDAVMEEYLKKNKDSITEKAYEKIESEIEKRRRLYSAKTTAERMAIYMIGSGYEITNLFLQKLLYYIKGFGYVFYKQNMLDMTCEAWVNGPVFPTIYEKYKEFGKETLSCENIEYDVSSLLSEQEKTLVDYVLDIFGKYNGWTLREFTHKEKPWQRAREGFEEYERCNNEISDESICAYFTEVDKKYDLKKLNGVQAYINSLDVLN